VRLGRYFGLSCASVVNGSLCGGFGLHLNRCSASAGALQSSARATRGGNYPDTGGEQAISHGSIPPGKKASVRSARANNLTRKKREK
jgi:hypothetical protein